MKKTILMVLASICISANAQDVLVTDEGTTIKAYNVEVATNKIFYTLSPESEDSKSIQKSKVLVWKKADGTNIVLAQGDISNSSANTSREASSPVQQPLSDELVAENKRQIAELNSRRIKFVGEKSDKMSSHNFYTLNISPNSIIEDNNIKLSFSIKKLDANKTNKRYINVLDKSEYNRNWNNISIYLSTTIHNKTNRTIYVDLANCFALLNGVGTPFYIPSATHVSSGSSSGVSMNAGAIAGALGVGGVLGTLAGGLVVGGGSTSTTTNVTYSQRVVSIPPMAALNLEPQYIGIRRLIDGKLHTEDLIRETIPSEYMVSDKKGNPYPVYYDLKRGEVFEIPDEKMTYPISMAYCYSFSENIESPQFSKVDFGLKSVVGAGSTWVQPVKDIDISANPLFYIPSDLHIKD